MIKKRRFNWHNGKPLYMIEQRVLGRGYSVTSWPSEKKPGYLRSAYPAYHKRDWYVKRRT